MKIDDETTRVVYCPFDKETQTDFLEEVQDNNKYFEVVLNFDKHTRIKTMYGIN